MNVRPKAIHNRLAHITYMDSCKRDFSAGFPTFCYIFITFILRNPSNSSIIRCSSVAKPWPYNPKVQGSNPTEAKKFFHSFQIKRLRDSIGCVIQLMIIAKLPWETRARGSNFKIRSTNRDLQWANLSIYNLASKLDMNFDITKSP